jgi:FKBP-type peptidyl-prolyl cis-trans isomerase FkpA
MKNYGITLITLAILAGGCQSAQRTPCTPTTTTTKADPAELAALKQFIDASGISAQVDERGFYYTIEAAGSGNKPTVCSNVTVNYAGKLTNGTTFDSADGARFDLNQLIVGWQEGIPLIAPGGRIILYLPPSLAYGAQAQNDIPANSILIFSINLVGVN